MNNNKNNEQQQMKMLLFERDSETIKEQEGTEENEQRTTETQTKRRDLS
jgi:hypothetical protein